MSQSLATIAPTTFSEVLAFAERIVDTDFVPKDMRGKPGAVLAAIQFGAELGIGPMQALTSLSVVNGRVGMSVDLMLAKVQASGLLAKLTRTFDAVPARYLATVVIQRKGDEKRTYTFGKVDADRIAAKEHDRVIKLSEKSTYRAYPQRMYPYRALGFALRDVFGDVLKGLHSQEELRDDAVIDSAAVKVEETVSPWAAVPEAVQPTLVAAFEKCKLSPAAQRVKLNEFKGRYDELLEVLRTEYANRQRIGGRKAKAIDAPAAPVSADENAAIDAEIVAKEAQ